MIFLWSAVISIAGLIADVLFIKSEYDGKMVKATVLKGIASLFFVILGVICWTYGKPEIGMLIVIGLVLGMVGDILLNMRNLYEGKKSNRIFALGILAFLSGHFMYIAFLIKNTYNPLPIGLILTAVLSVIAIPPLMKSINAPSKGLKIFGYVYLVIVIAMFSFATSMICNNGLSELSVVFEIGALLFVVSDFIMIYYSFGRKIKPLRAINLIAYYIGQLLIAFSILLLVRTLF